MIETLIEAIGDTPLLKLEPRDPEGAATLYVKLERFNPSVSLKDRNVLAMIQQAENEGLLRPGGTVIEPVAGNTGIALAHICNVKGYRLVLTMPADYMPERHHVLECCGTQIEITPAEEGIDGAIERARQIHRQHPEYVYLDHFSNEAQVRAHETGLVKEILADLGDVHIDAFIGSVGTGSSLTAIADVLQPHGTQMIAVEPAAAPFLSQGVRGVHKIPGIGFGFMPEYLRRVRLDRIETVKDEEALEGFRNLARETGVLGGLSCGANYWVAKKIAAELGSGKNILTIFYDGGERYFSLGKQLARKMAGENQI